MIISTLIIFIFIGSQFCIQKVAESTQKIKQKILLSVLKGKTQLFAFKEWWGGI